MGSVAGVHCGRKAGRGWQGVRFVIAVQHLVNVSGGKDSTATYLRAIESGREFRAVFADTGNEHPATLDYVASLAARTGGPEVETVRADFSAALARHREYVLRVWPVARACRGHRFPGAGQRRVLRWRRERRAKAGAHHRRNRQPATPGHRPPREVARHKQCRRCE
ncbi:phosphoadenosine phosphosulfate reductase family protein [Pseudoxanthomonas winnipegensis]|uniref:phosphoadenosine phosphosulfate reductase domain-containing protein n=1 Tax=Pseudoxanthomonas winnipegensis TaxID=2480810 RepID=UPI002E26D423